MQTGAGHRVAEPTGPAGGGGAGHRHRRAAHRPDRLGGRLRRPPAPDVVAALRAAGRRGGRRRDPGRGAARRPERPAGHPGGLLLRTDGAEGTAFGRPRCLGAGVRGLPCADLRPVPLRLRPVAARPVRHARRGPDGAGAVAAVRRGLLLRGAARLRRDRLPVRLPVHPVPLLRTGNRGRAGAGRRGRGRRARGRGGRRRGPGRVAGLHGGGADPDGPGCRHRVAPGLARRRPARGGNAPALGEGLGSGTIARRSRGSTLPGTARRWGRAQGGKPACHVVAVTCSRSSPPGPPSLSPPRACSRGRRRPSRSRPSRPRSSSSSSTR